MTDPIIRMRDIRAAKMCSSGTRYFFESHGLNWSDFLKNGIPASKLLETNNVLAERVVAVAKNGQQ